MIAPTPESAAAQTASRSKPHSSRAAMGGNNLRRATLP